MSLGPSSINRSEKKKKRCREDDDDGSSYPDKKRHNTEEDSNIDEELSDDQDNDDSVPDEASDLNYDDEGGWDKWQDAIMRRSMHNIAKTEDGKSELMYLGERELRSHGVKV